MNLCSMSCSNATGWDYSQRRAMCKFDDTWHKEGTDCPYREKPRVKDRNEVNHPCHYTKGKVECIDAIESATVGLVGIVAVLTGNVIKYIFRWRWKGGLQDLYKCRWYLNRLIDIVKDSKEEDDNG